jgi:hypothetical protein
MDVEVTEIGKEVATKVVLKRYSAGARNQAYREAAKIKGDVKSSGGSYDIDYILYNELRVVAAIESPVELKSLVAIRDKLYPEDFDKLVAAVDKLGEVTPLPSTI